MYSQQERDDSKNEEDWVQNSVTSNFDSKNRFLPLKVNIIGCKGKAKWYF